MTQDERRVYLIKYMLAEPGQYSMVDIPEDAEGQKRLLRALFNIRRPGPAEDEFIKIQDEYLQEETRQKGVTDWERLFPIQDGLYIWKGDITTLKCDAIVNAANSAMTGCYAPNHGCIDNIIHTYAGIQLRQECADIMEGQDHLEPTGHAKLTKAYNLPCKYVIHTVGPIVGSLVTDEDRDLLASCYRSCLEIALMHDVKSIAFCCISTGEFRFPHKEAAEIAVNTVKEFRASVDKKTEVIFNVFTEEDRQIYEDLLSRK